MESTTDVAVEFIDKDGLFIATSPDVPGLVVEEESYQDMVRAIKALVPELLFLDKRPTSNLTICISQRLSIGENSIAA
ncbi:MAG: DUF1902 domain-containing protein [Rhodospirillaceae bacterium]